MTGTDQAIGPDGLTRRDRDIIREILARYPEVRRATLFGSRAMGTFGRGSDIDLALEGPDLTTHTLARIATDLEDSDLPYKADLLLRDRDRRLDPKLEEHIRRHGRPFGWEQVTLGDHIHVKHGFAFKGEYFTDEATPDVLVTPGNFAIGGGFQDDKLKYYAGPVSGEYVLQAGDLVVTMTDLSKAGDTLGYPALIARSDGWRYLHNQRIGLIQVKYDTELDKRFLFYRLRADDYRHHILATASGSTVRHTSPGRILDFETTLPPVDEQRAIAGVLGALDDKIEQNRRTARALERLARAIFRAWFVDFEPVKAKAAGATTFPSMPQCVFDALPTHFMDSEIGPVPERWEVKPIGDVVAVRGGATPSTKNPEYWDNGVHCWATPKDMSRLSHPVLLDTERRITDAGVECVSSGLLSSGTVLMSSRAPVGYLAIAGVPTAINQGFIAMVCDGPLPPTYVLNWAQASMEAIHARASGTTFPEISKKIFRPLPVIVPSEPVISAFREIADLLFDLLVACVKENLQLETLRDYLLPRLLSGSVRVEAANG